jgi:universal stress protein A
MLPKKILLCVDFSENSEPACTLALEYAKAFDAALSIVHVIDTWSVHAFEDRRSIDEEHPVLADLEILARPFREILGDVTTCVRVGSPTEEIIRCANQESADLIVMGTRGWTGFAHAMLGSVAEGVTKTANCPVLIVRSFFSDPIRRENDPLDEYSAKPSPNDNTDATRKIAGLTRNKFNDVTSCYSSRSSPLIRSLLPSSDH